MWDDLNNNVFKDDGMALFVKMEVRLHSATPRTVVYTALSEGASLTPSWVFSLNSVNHTWCLRMNSSPT